MKLRAVVAISFALVFAAPRHSVAVDADAVNECHQDIAKGIAGVKRGRTAQVSRCLKELNYDTCIETDSHTAIHENELRNHVAGAGTPCRQALDSGATIADFGPTTCANHWEDCDTEVAAIATLDDLVDCVVCSERGFDFEMRAELGMPRPAPADADERRCTRRISRLVATTVRKSVLDAASCAEGGVKPFACPVDASDASRFGHALVAFPRSIAACKIDEGKAPGALTSLCGGTATDSAALTTCFESVAKCIACYTANEALGQSEDCAAFSGLAACDGTF